MGRNKGVYSMSSKIAVILSGCGGLDGAETHEAVCSLLAIEKESFLWTAYALDENQKKVVSHSTAQEIPGERNMMAEAGRLVHGKINNIDTLKVQDHDVLWFVGGFGVVTSLSDLLEKGASGSVHPKVSAQIKAFYEAKKPIVALCVAPSIIAKALEGKGLMLTLGKTGEYDNLLQEAGHEAISKESDDFLVDEENHIYTTPAYMNPDCTPLKVFNACHLITKALLKAGV